MGWGGAEPVKVRIRGVEYPSISAAAKALGVSRAAVQQGIAKGNLDRVGLKAAAKNKEPQE